MRILVLNPGSVTLKATVLDLPSRDPAFERTLDWTADPGGEEQARTVRSVVQALTAAGLPGESVTAVGYRVVHGGERFTAPVAIDDDTVEAIAALRDLAPLHNPLAVATIRAARAALPAPVHVAAFDTSFHATLPVAGLRYPVPDRWLTDWGVRRYGFHGLAVAWAARRAAELLEAPPGELRLVVAHLGGGCSVTAVDGDRSADTSMGLTPLEGLMMATRSGSIDPGAMLRVLRAGHPVEEVARDLEERSGLLGVSGRSADMRELLQAEAEGDERAALAIELFVRRAAAGIGAAATHLLALDGLVFSGGIGEHAAAVRARIVGRLGVLDVPEVAGDPAAGPGDDQILAPGPPSVLKVHAREDVVIAEAAAALAGAGQEG